MKAKPHLWRWAVSVLAGGCLLQAASCSLSDESLAALAQQVFTRQTANVLSDAVFFLLDNMLVRWTG